MTAKIYGILENFGFSISYSEVKLYEMCASGQMETIIPFIQIVSDNSDFNVCTLNGLGTIEVSTHTQI